MQPVDQRADRRIFVVFQKRRVVERAQKLAAPFEFLPKKLVVDVEAQGLGGGVKVRSVDEQRQALVLVEHEMTLSQISAGAFAAASLKLSAYDRNVSG